MKHLFSCALSINKLSPFPGNIFTKRVKQPHLGESSVCVLGRLWMLRCSHGRALWLWLNYIFFLPQTPLFVVSEWLVSQTFFISWKDTLAHIQCNHLRGFYFSPHRPGEMTSLLLINKTIQNAKKNGFILNLSLTPTVPVWFGRACFPVSSWATISFCSLAHIIQFFEWINVLFAILTNTSTAGSAR